MNDMLGSRKLSHRDRWHVREDVLSVGLFIPSRGCCHVYLLPFYVFHSKHHCCFASIV